MGRLDQRLVGVASPQISLEAEVARKVRRGCLPLAELGRHQSEPKEGPRLLRPGASIPGALQRRVASLARSACVLHWWLLLEHFKDRHVHEFARWHRAEQRGRTLAQQVVALLARVRLGYAARREPRAAEAFACEECAVGSMRPTASS